MSTILSLPEELIIEIMVKGDHNMLLTCQRVCRTLNAIIKDSVPLQYIISLAECGMRDGLSAIVYERTSERLQQLREHEAAWREVAWSDGNTISQLAARDLPTTSSGGVLAFLKQSDGDSGDPEYGDRLFLLRVPSRLRGIPGENWELNGLGEMSNVCIDSAQDLLLFQRYARCPRVQSCDHNLPRRSNNFHVRTLSSGKVHPSVLHSGSFDLGIASSDLLTEIPVICCDHVAAIVHEHSAALTIKGTVVVWNWKTGIQVAIIRPLFARIGRDISFLDETHILIPASAVDSALKPGQNYELMLLVYDFDPSVTLFINQVATIPYCFRISLPVRTGITTFRQARINANTASFSSPTASSSSPSGYFHTDPKDRIIALEVTDNNWMQGMEETAELYTPARTFLAYIAAHPPVAASASVSTSISGQKPLDVPWEAWGPHGAHLVRAPDQPYIVRRPRVCGMRVLGASLCNRSVVVADYHPGRVARSVGLGGGGGTGMRARALSTFSEILLGTRGALGARPPSMCITKEVPLPCELQETSESPWIMLCEDALVAFEVSGELGFDFDSFFPFGTSRVRVLSDFTDRRSGYHSVLGIFIAQYAPDGFEVSRVVAYTF
ncbi:hypothetical protein EDB92DRAFT_1574727 [Lactarius akahatsu]|uniref:F-box domain-containing protein n=1 Tax=Lactarius akahatsu TaxID=416441 RepID=A0AAD4L7K3_9AGAM|nr:hypothetical protein EDB92DRAFT_1574727 [Lactarius akahatsu]